MVDEFRCCLTGNFSYLSFKIGLSHQIHKFRISLILGDVVDYCMKRVPKLSLCILTKNTFFIPTTRFNIFFIANNFPSLSLNFCLDLHKFHSGVIFVFRLAGPTHHNVQCKHIRCDGKQIESICWNERNITLMFFGSFLWHIFPVLRQHVTHIQINKTIHVHWIPS